MGKCVPVQKGVRRSNLLASPNVCLKWQDVGSEIVEIWKWIKFRGGSSGREQRRTHNRGVSASVFQVLNLSYHSQSVPGRC